MEFGFSVGGLGSMSLHDLPPVDVTPCFLSNVRA